MEWSDSSSEDELEEIPAFIRKNSFENDMEINSKRSSKKPSRLDALLAEHRREGRKDEKLREMRDQLLTEIANNAAEGYKEDNQDLASEHADHIQQLKVKSIKLRTLHPGLAVFNSDNFGCLFSDSLGPVSYFVKTGSFIDRIWSSSSFDTLGVQLLSTDTLIDNIAASPNFSGVMQWLLDLMSIHSSTMAARNIETIMVTILKKLQLKRKLGAFWKPSSMGLLRLLVNLGADPNDLTYFQTTFTQDQIRKHLTPAEDKNVIQLHTIKINSEQFQSVLTVMTLALQGRSVLAKEDLNLMFYMLAKSALDTSLDASLANNFHQCFASIIDHYSDFEWPAAVPELCRYLNQVTSHHHNQVYLASLLPATEPRGSYLQIRLCYTFLYNQLSADAQKLDNSHLIDMKLNSAAELGVCVEKGQPSTLATRLHKLVKSDRYKAFSALRLLDMFVGDTSCREAAQKKQLEYLQSQVALVRNTIKDRVCDLDLSKVKDMMYDMTVRWSLALQDQRMNEGSIFPWATASTHQWVKTEILMDKKKQNLLDKADEDIADINPRNETCGS